jgi:transcriptional regulator
VGPDAYVSPSWYPSKAEHGRVVPTWNFITVQARGEVCFHTDAAWTRAQVSSLTDTHEAGLDPPWSLDDAPGAYVDGMLRAIVGFEVRITSLEGKWKLSQNRSAADVAGVVAGLRARTGDVRAAAVADQMSTEGRDPTTPGPESP